MSDVVVIYKKSLRPITIKPTTTIKELKAIINSPNTTIKLFFRDGRELMPIVFETDKYDHVDFSQYSDVLYGTKIYLEDKQLPTVYVLFNSDSYTNNDFEDALLITSLSLKTIHKYWVDNYLKTRLGIFLTKYKLTEIDYDNPEVVDGISREIELSGYLKLYRTQLV